MLVCVFRIVCNRAGNGYTHTHSSIRKNDVITSILFWRFYELQHLRDEANFCNIGCFEAHCRNGSGNEHDWMSVRECVSAFRRHYCEGYQGKERTASFSIFAPRYFALSTPPPHKTIRSVMSSKQLLARGVGRAFDMVMKKGKGSWIWTSEDRKLLDFTSGVCVANVGHGHPRVIKAAQQQIETLAHGMVRGQREMHSSVPMLPQEASAARALLTTPVLLCCCR